MTDIEYNQNQIIILNKFRQRIRKDRFINNQASTFYSKQNSKFVIPGILITGVASIASFMSTSDILSDDIKKSFTVGVGIMTACSAILQSISSSFGFQSRAEQFQKSADAYDSLLTKIEFEIINPNEDFNEFCSSIENNILTIKNECNYLPPLFIYKLWDQYKNDKIKNNSILSNNNSILNNNHENNNHENNNHENNNHENENNIINIPDENIALFKNIDTKNKNNNYNSINFFNSNT